MSQVLLACYGAAAPGGGGGVPAASGFYGVQNGNGTPASNFVCKINPTNAVTSAEHILTLSGSTIYKTLALAARPSDSVLFGVVQTINSGSSGRKLVMVDPATGACILVGALAEAIAGLAFAGDDTLYGISGFSSDNPQTLFSVNTTTAALSLLVGLPHGNQGEAIGFHIINGKLYHLSGHSTKIFESVNVSTFVVTGISSGVIVGTQEVTALGYNPGDSGMYLVDSVELFTINITTGAWTSKGVFSNAMSCRGIAFVP